MLNENRFLGIFSGNGKRPINLGFIFIVNNMSLEATPELTNATKRQTSTVNAPHFMILFTLISLCHAHIFLLIPYNG